MQPALAVSVIGICLLLYAISSFRKLASLFKERAHKRILLEMGVLFALLIAVFFGFAALLAADVGFRDPRIVMSLLVLLSAVSIALFVSLAVLVGDINLKRMAELQEAYAGLMSLDRKKDSFVRIAVRELRRPATAIGGFTRLLRKGSEDAATRAKYLTILNDEALHLSSLMEDLGDLAAIDCGSLPLKAGQMRLSLALKDLEEFDILARREGVRTDYALAGPDMEFLADRQRLNQVLVALWTAAHRHTPPEKGVAVTAASKPGEIFFRVQGAGFGIGGNGLAAFFERVFDGKAEDGGKEPKSGELHLALCKLLAEAMGGSISAEVSQGGSEACTFTLPSGTQTPQAHAAGLSP